MALSDTSIRAAKPKDKPYKMADAGGLFLLVNPTGSKLWRLKYRIDGREKLLAIGAYPAVALAAARAKRDEAKTLLASGTDPSQVQKESRKAEEDARNNTFRLVADEYLAKLRSEGRAASTMGKLEWLLSFVPGDLGDMPLRSISAPMILEALRRVEARGRYETANRMRSTIGAVFRYAVATGRADADPTGALKGALVTPKVQHRAAILDPKKFGALLRAIDGYDGQPATKAALQLMPLLIPRPGELRLAEWSEFDLDGAVWTIPASRTKMRREHRVPLPKRAVEILVGLKSIYGFGTLAFPSVRSVRRAISENTMNAALRRMGYSTDEMSPHGFRATASTLLNESGLWNPDAIERQLAHVEGNEVRRAYARGEHWEERVRMMDWWAEKLEEWKQ